MIQTTSAHAAGSMDAWTGLETLRALSITNSTIISPLPSEWPAVFPQLEQLVIVNTELNGTLPAGVHSPELTSPCTSCQHTFAAAARVGLQTPLLVPMMESFALSSAPVSAT